jgi:hypothetical protein
MRAIGQSERALEALCRRALSREAFGKPLAQLGANYDIIAESRMKIEMARLLCLKAAYMMDTVGQREASPWISQIKVIAPRIALEITDEAVQMHGAMGITQDTPLAHMWTHLRTLGPTAPTPCCRQVARAELKRYTTRRCKLLPSPREKVEMKGGGAANAGVAGEMPKRRANRRAHRRQPYCAGASEICNALAIAPTTGRLPHGLVRTRPHRSIPLRCRNTSSAAAGLQGPSRRRLHRPIRQPSCSPGSRCIAAQSRRAL